MVRLRHILPIFLACSLSAQDLKDLVHHNPDPVKAADFAAAQLKAEVFIGHGLSMEPVCKENCVLLVKPINYEHIKTGMLIVFSNRERIIAHVVVAEDANGYITKGINNSEVDRRSVREQDLIGVVIAIYAP
jgi:signal peptidase I